MNKELFDGRPFHVTIDRGCVYRRYILYTVEKNGSFKRRTKPMYREVFEECMGFSPEWPHEINNLAKTETNPKST